MTIPTSRTITLENYELTINQHNSLMIKRQGSITPKILENLIPSFKGLFNPDLVEVRRADSGAILISYEGQGNHFLSNDYLKQL